MRSRKNGKDAFTALLFTDCTEHNLNRAYSPKAVPVSDNPGSSFMHCVKINPIHKSMTHSHDVIFCHESYFSTYVVIGKGGRLYAEAVCGVLDYWLAVGKFPKLWYNERRNRYMWRMY